MISSFVIPEAFYPLVLEVSLIPDSAVGTKFRPSGYDCSIPVQLSISFSLITRLRRLVGVLYSLPYRLKSFNPYALHYLTSFSS
jgi:hypothetical protein